ncbi:6084_t:CDS:2, partial [Dentiscutata heterogama]
KFNNFHELALTEERDTYNSRRGDRRNNETNTRWGSYDQENNLLVGEITIIEMMYETKAVNLQERPKRKGF